MSPLLAQPSSIANQSKRQKKGPRGYDAGKKATGRKRHLVVDTLGLVMAIVVHAANVQDRDGAKLVLSKLAGRYPRLQLIWADAGYAGQLVDWAYTFGGWLLEIARRPSHSHRFVVLPRRWVVERTLAWLGRYRRLSKDYEALPETSEPARPISPSVSVLLDVSVDCPWASLPLLPWYTS